MAVITDFVYVSADGFHYPDYETILEMLKSEFRNIYGKDIYIEPDSQDGQWLTIQALALFEMAQVAAKIYASFSPTTATGDALTRNVKINGLRRKSATYSTAELKVVGENGTRIPIGSLAKDKAGNKWQTTADVTIGATGEALVNAQATEIGAITALANTITEIATPQKGWQSVTNPADALEGVAVETDFELRLRQSRSVALPSQTINEGILGAIFSLENVQRAKLYENDTAETDANGLPPHSINAVVYGGDAGEIAQVIANKKTPGTKAFGDVCVEIVDRYNNKTSYCFSRPTIKKVSVKIKIKPLLNYLVDYADVIKENVQSYVEATDIGGTLYLSKLYVPANLANTETGGTFDVTEITIKIGDGEYAVQNVTCSRTEMLECEAVIVELDANG